MEDDTSTLSFDKQSRKLYCPLGDRTEGTDPLDAVLSHVPWRLKSDNKTDSNDGVLSHLPTYNYLDLRRQQNEAWASGRLKEGNSLIFQDPEQAEHLFKQGLDLVPDNVDLLVSYGHLLLRSKRFALATAKFHRALEVDPEFLEAKEGLNRVRLQQNMSLQQSARSQAPTTTIARESAMLNDVLFERSQRANSVTRQEEIDQVVDTAEDQSVDSSRRNRKKRKNRRKKRRHRHKKRKRHRSRSPSYSSASSDESSSSFDSYRKHKKRRKRHNSSPSPGSPPDSKIAGEAPGGDGGNEAKRKRDEFPSHPGSPNSSVDDESPRDARHQKHRKRPKHSHSKSKHKKRKHRRREDSAS